MMTAFSSWKSLPVKANVAAWPSAMLELPSARMLPCSVAAVNTSLSIEAGRRERSTWKVERGPFKSTVMALSGALFWLKNTM